MTNPPAPRRGIGVDLRRRLATGLVFLGGVALGVGSTLVASSAPEQAGAAAVANSAPGSSAFGLPLQPAAIASARPSAGRDRAAATSAPPLEVLIPKIRVRSGLVGLRLNRDGTVQVPDSYSEAGWYRDGPAPGDKGAALILGHVDSKTGPGVFHKLRELRSGDPILVRRADGTTARFLVYRLAKYAKARFPAASVYAATARPELRLVTCAGAFSRGTYADNLVAYARLAPARKPAAKPTAKSAVKPVAKPAGKPATRPAARPAAKAATKPAAARTKPAAKPAPKPALLPPLKPALRPPLKPAPVLAPIPTSKPALQPTAGIRVRPAGRKPAP